MKEGAKVSPMMAQWHACKERAGDALLLFRMGDFYEAFYDDAVALSKELDLTLTKRQDSIPMAGVPHHTCDSYIDKLVAKGLKVAVAEQLGDPAKAKGLVKREVVRVVTPGSVISSSLLSDKANNFFASVCRVGERFGLSCLDLTTGEFYILEFGDFTAFSNELHRIRPSELLVSPRFLEKHPEWARELKLAFPCRLNEHEEWKFAHEVAYNFLIAHFKVQSLDGFGLRGVTAGVNAGGALLQHLQEELYLSLSHVRRPATYTTEHYLSLDPISCRNLELTESLKDGGRKNTLLEVLDKSRTPMGARLMRRWIKQPLLSPEQIGKRQDAVGALYKNPRSLERLAELLDSVRDLERLITKVSSGYAGPRDLAALGRSFEPMPQIKALLKNLTPAAAALREAEQALTPLPEMRQLIERALVDEPPARVSDGRLFREGFNEELDELCRISRSSKTWIAEYQARIREQCGIKTLKVGYNRMFGYYLEVSKGQADKVPESFERRQTLVNAERFISPELKDYETKVLTAEERISAIESELFCRLRMEVAKFSEAVFSVARLIAEIDALQALTTAARRHDYVRPIVDSSDAIEITEGRHPVIEAAGSGEKFTPNDTLLDGEGNRLLLITGPNMSGKSTYIRQVALIAVMAQIGSFVPAKSARIGVIDKVFTRIGASDDLTRGQSTFMVEMSETANILNNATDRSLVILDEIGRGTSTYDGISIAWSVAEYLLTVEGRMAKTLFATHYWELTKLEEKVPGAVNYNVAVHEEKGHITFLHKIVKGSTDKSYGIHVGRLAGLPPQVLARSQEILQHLEENANRKGIFEPTGPRRPPAKRKRRPSNELQMSFFG